jgi:serine/threonine protein phosphatase PrpC
VKIGAWHATTDPGRRRFRNEDAYVGDPPLFAVADGMGGAQAGELASAIAAAALEERARGRHGTDAIVDLVQEANARVHRRSLEDPTAAGMGTTVTVALVDDESGTVALGHVGDSRAYLYRRGVLEQLTADHTLVAELVRTGRLTQEEAEVHPQRSVITRVLGTDEDVDVDTSTVAAEAGDLFLICSDGLPAMLRDADIQQIVESQNGDPKRVADALVEAANRAGGEDNVTVVAFEIVEQPADFDGATAETAVPRATEDASASPHAHGVHRHGASHGSRAVALAAILVALTAAVLLVWWGIAR